MNYLAHAFLSGDHPEVQLGGLLGDFCKGPLPQYPLALSDTSPAFLGKRHIHFGIQHHRSIDAFSDSLQSFRQCAALLDNRFRRVAPIIVDICFDHYLAKHWHQHHTQGLPEFAEGLYAAMENCPQAPDGFVRFRQRSQSAGLFNLYQEPDTIAVALDRVAQRFSRPQLMAGAYENWQSCYSEMEKGFEQCFADIKHFAASRLADEGYSISKWQ
ncbi:ACP phosphodiesterase [Pseudoteredinibacter isoporae]|uniref:acyl carrier protein phosphodiesterase n=1 Tax=Pseudoteredinibacter isoporae TaxID=570281 RepID=UPI0031099C83